MSSEMPAWPTRVPSSRRAGKEVTEQHRYERSLRLAWEARARLAVEALQTIVDAATEYTEYEHNVAHKAITAIGPLPPMDGER